MMLASLKASVPESVVTSVMANTDISVFFSHSLRYVVVNDAACSQLGRTRRDLEGQSLLALYPQVIASDNHRNLLRALSGEYIRNAIIEASNGQLFACNYRPIFAGERLLGVLTSAARVAH